MHSLYRPGQLPHRRLLGRRPGAARSRRSTRRRSGSRSSATRPARRRARTATTSRRPTSTAVEIDGELTELGRRFFDLDNPQPDDLRRGRAAVARALGRRLRRDHRRRLPPALHPVLPGDPRVLRAGPRPARAGRGRDRERRPPRGQRRPREGPRPHDGRGVPDVCPRPDRGHEHAAARRRGPGLGERLRAAAATAAAARAREHRRRSRRRASARGSPGARSTPTTAPRSSG